MVSVVRIEPNVFVAPQLDEADFAEIAALGFRSVVGNRPDGEAPGQLPSARAALAARQHGLEFRYQPVANPNVTDEPAVLDFLRAMTELPGPVLYYCRTGTRCTILWAQAAVRRLGVVRTLEATAQAGFDLEVLREHLEELSDDVGADGVGQSTSREVSMPVAAT